MRKCDYGVIQDAVPSTQSPDGENTNECLSERQSLEKEPEAVQASLKKMCVEKRDSKPESHEYSSVQPEAPDGTGASPLQRQAAQRRHHAYEEIKLEREKDKTQSVASNITLSSGRTSPTLSDSTSGSESPLLSRRHVPVTLTPATMSKHKKLSAGSWFIQNSFDTDESGDEGRKKKSRPRSASQGQSQCSRTLVRNVLL